MNPADVESIRQRHAQREAWLLAALVFFLPLFEAPKNLLWLAFLVTWGVHSRQRRDAGGPWRGWWSWDGLIVITLVSALAGTALSGLKGNEWVGVRDLFRYLPVLWVLSRSEYSQRQWTTVTLALLAGTVLAVFWGLWQWWQSGAAEMGLHSVGHSNHSATFLCIVFGAALALGLDAQARSKEGVAAAMRSPHPRVLALLTAAVLGVGVLAAGSRIGLAVAALLVLLLPLSAALRKGSSRKSLAVMLGVALVAAAVIAVSQPWVLRKHQRNMGENNVLAYRDALWSQALTAWRAHPLWGVGMDNFARITVKQLNDWEREQGRPQSPANIYQSVHAHSLYLDTLSERGLAGALPLTGLLLGWLAALWRWRPWRSLPDDPARDFMRWGAAASALFATAVIGLVNTTLHTELALVAMVFLGGLIGVGRPRAQQPPPGGK